MVELKSLIHHCMIRLKPDHGRQQWTFETLIRDTPLSETRRQEYRSKAGIKYNKFCYATQFNNASRAPIPEFTNIDHIQKKPRVN